MNIYIFLIGMVINVMFVFICDMFVLFGEGVKYIRILDEKELVSVKV